MSQDLLIPFLPRVVQNRLEKPKLNVKRISKEPRISQEAYQEENQYEHYDQNNIVVSRHTPEKDNARQGKPDSGQAQEQASSSQNDVLATDDEVSQNTDLSEEQIEAFEHPTYEKDEIFEHKQQKKLIQDHLAKTQDRSKKDDKPEDDDEKHIDILI